MCILGIYGAGFHFCTGVAKPYRCRVQINGADVTEYIIGDVIAVRVRASVEAYVGVATRVTSRGQYISRGLCRCCYTRYE